MTETKYPERTVADIVQALTVLLDAIDAHDVERAKLRERKPFPRLRLYTMDELIADCAAHGPLLDDPIGRALRLGVRECGQALAKKASISEMQDAVDTASRHRTHLGDVADKAWDGLVLPNGDRWIA